MDTIWKYQLEITDRQEIFMPYSAKILTVQVQHNILCLWARVNTDQDPVFGEEKKKRVIEIIGTGNPIPNLAIYETHRRYISTCVMGYFVWHIFEIKLN
jgi:hypothetical protein